MKTTTTRSIACLLGTLLFGLACGPLGPLAGGQLSGQVEAAPVDWSFTDAVDTVQLETNPTDPYSVNIWGATVGNSFYVAAGSGEESKWAGNIEGDPNVRLRVNGEIYELRAVRVDGDPSTREAFLAALQKKYDYELPNDEEAQQAWLYRLDPR